MTHDIPRDVFPPPSAQDPIHVCDAATAKALSTAPSFILSPFEGPPEEAEYVMSANPRRIDLRDGRRVKVSNGYFCSVGGSSLAVAYPNGSWFLHANTDPHRKDRQFRTPLASEEGRVLLSVEGQIVGCVTLDYTRAARLAALERVELSSVVRMFCVKDPMSMHCIHVNCVAARQAELRRRWDVDHPDLPASGNPWIWVHAVSPRGESPRKSTARRRGRSS